MYLTVHPTIHQGTFPSRALFCRFNMDPPLGEKWDKVCKLKALRLRDSRDKCSTH